MKVVFGALGLILIAVAVFTGPDIRRYLKIRAM
jgi:hypothetical protein